LYLQCVHFIYYNVGSGDANIDVKRVIVSFSIIILDWRGSKSIYYYFQGKYIQWISP